MSCYLFLFFLSLTIRFTRALASSPSLAANNDLIIESSVCIRQGNYRSINILRESFFAFFFRRRDFFCFVLFLTIAIGVANFARLIDNLFISKVKPYSKFFNRSPC